MKCLVIYSDMFANSMMMPYRLLRFTVAMTGLRATFGSPSAPVSGTGTGFGPLPSRERGLVVGLDLFTRVTLPPRHCGLDPQSRGEGRARTRHCGLDPPVHRDENDKAFYAFALQAHTLAQRDRRLVNPEVRGGPDPSIYFRFGARSEGR